MIYPANQKSKSDKVLRCLLNESDFSSIEHGKRRNKTKQRTRKYDERKQERTIF